MGLRFYNCSIFLMGVAELLVSVVGGFSWGGITPKRVKEVYDVNALHGTYIREASFLGGPAVSAVMSFGGNGACHAVALLAWSTEVACLWETGVSQKTAMFGCFGEALVT